MFAMFCCLLNPIHHPLPLLSLLKRHHLFHPLISPPIIAHHYINEKRWSHLRLASYRRPSEARQPRGSSLKMFHLCLRCVLADFPELQKKLHLKLQTKYLPCHKSRGLETAHAFQFGKPARQKS